MLDVHIDDFYKDCASILLLGFRYFPRPQTLFIEDISGPDQVDEFGLHSPRHTAGFGAVLWMKDEGYIRFSDHDGQKSVDDFVLTSKAFRALLQTTDSDDPSSQLVHSLEYARLEADTSLLARLFQHYILDA